MMRTAVHSMPADTSSPAPELALDARYARVRARTDALVAGLSDADATVQSMDDASPAKWHLAHSSWFFETFVLVPHAPGYRVFDRRYDYLFNSYYESVGPRQPRPRRGMLTRPTLAEIGEYRRHVDAAMVALARTGSDAGIAALIELGLNHEEQHQELLLTDILHLFAQNPLQPAYRPAPMPVAAPAATLGWLALAGGIASIGHDGARFAFDCEGPRHAVLLRPCRLADRLVTNDEWLAFMADGGYEQPTLWLSDGWTRVRADGWRAPLYWQERGDGWQTMTLAGPQPVDLHAPVVHVSYFEADAFSRWAGKRLPGEAEWEVAAGDPRATQMFGEVWQWTASPFAGYPGFRAAGGAIGEYNGKFMCGQFVLRGSSRATPAGHSRATYRNFFYPHQRWQFTGLRLAEDR